MVELPDDLYLIIFGFLDLKEILLIRTQYPHSVVQASKQCLRVTQAAGLWRSLTREQIIRDNLPVPGFRGANIDDLPGPELERLLRRALELWRNWKSPFPVAKEIQTLKALDPGRIIFLEFMKRPGCSWLVSVSVRVDHPQRRWYTVECWDVKGSPKCIARRVFHQFLGLVLNQSASVGHNSSDIAIQAPFITTYIIHPSPTDPEIGFYPTAQFSEREEQLHLFCGTRMLTSSLRGERLLVWDTQFPRLSFELHNPGPAAGQPNLPVLAAISNGQYVTVVRQGTCELYAVPRLEPGGGTVAAHRTIQPLCEHVWPWRVDSVVLSEMASYPPERLSSRPPGMNMLIRFHNGLPWPINLLHRFDLHPNPRWEEDAAVFDSESRLNIPYQFPPVIQQTIAAPLRIVAQTDMVLGSHGTAVWIDSHTEDYFGHADRGQRLASRASLTRHIVSDVGDQDSGQSLQDASPDEDISDHVATTLEASVMRWHESERWVKLAVDEEEGKVALGCKDGSEITLLSFA